jgi:6-phosphogluconolactonase
VVYLAQNNAIYILPSPEDVHLSVAEDFTQRAIAAVQSKGEFTVVLSGGDTPKSFFDVLSSVKRFREMIPWEQIKFFFGDERYVPSDNLESNYHMANEHLFSKVSILKENIYRMKTDFKDPQDAARDYETTIRQFFHIKENEFPTFDLIYLGLGEDAHTASLMPFSEVVENYSKEPEKLKSHRLVESIWVQKQNMYRITLTPPVINHADNIIFIVTGLNKASAVSSALAGAFEPKKYPAQLIHCRNNKNIWYLDKAAANKIDHLHFQNQ